MTDPKIVIPVLRRAAKFGMCFPPNVLVFLTGLSRSRVRDLIASRVFQEHRIGGQSLVTVESVLAWYRRRESKICRVTPERKLQKAKGL